MMDKKIKYILIILLSFILVYSSFGYTPSPNYTPITNKCVDCHDGYTAPYKRPHNDTVMCEQCHTTHVHGIGYIQPDGSLGYDNSTAATCADCHEAAVPGFISPAIPDIKHSSKISNGSIWGSFWSSRKGASCIFCHGDAKHAVKGLGKINDLTNDATNIRNGSVSATTWCGDCHYNDPINGNYKGYLWNPAPPLITSNNTDNSEWINHTSVLMGNFSDARCISCHPLNGTYPDVSGIYVHSITHPSYNTEAECRNCHGNTVDRHHALAQGGKYGCTDCHQMKQDDQGNFYPEVIRDCIVCHAGKHS